MSETGDNFTEIKEKLVQEPRLEENIEAPKLTEPPQTESDNKTEPQNCDNANGTTVETDEIVREEVNVVVENSSVPVLEDESESIESSVTAQGSSTCTTADEEEDDEEDDTFVAQSEDEEAEEVTLEQQQNQPVLVRNDIDKLLKYLDDTDPNHKLRSLCKKGDENELAEFLDGNPELDLNVASEEGWTCLHEIITHECQFTRVAQVLVNRGANVNTQDLHGDSPLHSTLLYHNTDNILLLLKNGADLSLVNGVGRTPIHVADDFETLRLLLENGADVNCQDNVGNTPLHYAVVARDKERIRLLLSQSGVNVNLPNRSGATPLHLTGDSDIAQTLLQASADPNARDANANTPLHSAVRGRHKEIVRLLLERKADVALLNANGKTPVSLAKDKEMKHILQGKVTPSPSPTPAGKKKKPPSKPGSPAVITPLLAANNSPSILKKRKRENGETDTPVRKGPRLKFSEVIDYSGVEIVNELLSSPSGT